jgi:catechol 2,3-dioxygenase-like lactoylglutathione lyase family enzyme
VRVAHIGDKRHYLAMFETSRKVPAPQDDGVPGVKHFGFVVESLEALGIKVPPEAEKHFEPGHRLYFRDPDDIEVELVEHGDRT